MSFAIRGRSPAFHFWGPVGLHAATINHPKYMGGQSRTIIYWLPPLRVPLASTTAKVSPTPFFNIQKSRPRVIYWGQPRAAVIAAQTPTVFDVAHGTDSIQAITASFSITDLATGIENLSASLPLTITDTMAGVDNPFMNAVTAQVFDTAVGADSFSASISLLVGDALTGADGALADTGDVTSSQLPWRIIKSGRGQLIPWFNATAGIKAQVTDAAVGTEVLIVTADMQIVDVAATVEALSIVAQNLVNIADALLGTDVLVPIPVTFTLTDAGTLNDATLSIVASINISDEGGVATDLVQVATSVLVNILDSVVAADVVNNNQVTVQITLTDLMQATEFAGALEKAFVLSEGVLGVDGVIVEGPSTAAPIVSVTFNLKKRSAKYTLH